MDLASRGAVLERFNDRRWPKALSMKDRLSDGRSFSGYLMEGKNSKRKKTKVPPHSSYVRRTDTEILGISEEEVDVFV